MDTIAFRLNERVRLPDRREGLVLGVFSGGAPPDDPSSEGPPDVVTVLTDDYFEVACWPWQVAKVRWARGQMVKSKDPEGSFYPAELANIARLHMAIWHDHWERFPPGVDKWIPNSHSRYWDEYRNGNKVPLPEREDIRAQVPAPAHPSPEGQQVIKRNLIGSGLLTSFPRRRGKAKPLQV